MSNLYIGVCIAPYRVDFCNYLYHNCDFKIYHQYRSLSDNYNMDNIYSKCDFEEQYLEIGSTLNRKYSKGIKKIIDVNNPKMIIVPEFSLITLQILFLKYLFGYKYRVISVCDDSYDMICGNDFSKGHRWARKIIPYFLDNLILDNKKTVEWYQRKFKKGIYFPIIADNERLRGEYKKALPLSNQLNREQNLIGKKVILFVGRLIPLKNISMLIRAYSQIKDKAKLVVVGTGECADELRRLDSELKTNVIFTGFKQGEELNAWYNIADVFVLPSILEPFGAVTNEALIAGCRCLVSEKAGSCTLIKENINGNIFNPNSEGDLLNVMSSTLAKIKKDNDIILKEDLMPSTFAYYIHSLMKKF